MLEAWNDDDDMNKFIKKMKQTFSYTSINKPVPIKKEIGKWMAYNNSNFVKFDFISIVNYCDPNINS